MDNEIKKGGPVGRLENGLTIKQDAFVYAYVLNGGNTARAAISAGYSENGAQVRGGELLKMALIRQYITELRRDMYQQDASLARKIRMDLLKAKDTPATVKASICQDILDKAGDKEVQVIQEVTRETGSQLDDRIEQLSNLLGVKLVTDQREVIEVNPEGMETPVTIEE